MKSSYLDYAMSVIVSRALPDVRDGLKPVHRRILYACQEAGYVAGRPYRKCSRIVGDVMGKYHPHGDSAIYFALARLAQRSEEHTSELQSLMRISYAVFCLKRKKTEKQYVTKERVNRTYYVHGQRPH